ncbi:hypothetical protein [Halomarina oriensis]|uniref:Uncharacterized protein n=1 Tax=Halomarina oriensis TaxID=671145 RepID=A0A6B0GNN0_9EURY|nr:hypothetical protein [Halomarina oriensis]MWG33198.1 hypothetical protein [Halomarina oriensis]
MVRPVDLDALVTFAAIVLCGAIVVPLLALSVVDGLLVLSAWVVSLVVSSAAALAVARRPTVSTPSERA